jgi:hypothetical protein
MADCQVRISATLLRRALLDAIDWEESFLATHDPYTGQVTSCCTPKARCDAYRAAAALVHQYERALERVGGKPATPEGRDVPLQDIARTEN